MDNSQPLPHLEEHLFVGTKSLGVRRGIWWFRKDNGEAGCASGTTFFCPKCNDIWARRVMRCTVPDHPEIGDWLDPRIETRRCEKHGNGSIVFSEFEWDHLLDPYYSTEYTYPLVWLAYELFLIVRRYP